MKIYCSYNLDKTPTTGKGIFLSRLIPELQARGVEITDDPEVDHDIAFHIVKLRNRTKAKQVIRMDGVYFNSKSNFAFLNRELNASLHDCDGVVYQSEYSKNMCDKYLNPFVGPSDIIYNGAKGDAGGDCYDAGYEINFITAARWRRHKRLYETVTSFLAANIPDSHLWIAGEIPADDPIWAPIIHSNAINITTLGNVSNSELTKYYRNSAALIHLCPFDSCPNSVVEAIQCGCYIVHSDWGGTKEIVPKLNSHMVPEYKTEDSWSYEPIDTEIPPKMDTDLVVGQLRTIHGYGNSMVLPKEDAVTDINVCAESYINFFKRVIG